MSTVKGLGFDLVDVARIRRVLKEHQGAANRLFTDGEREHAKKYSEPAIHFAACFAAKEAYLKALGTGIAGQRLSDIELSHDKAGRPVLVVCGQLLPALVSISHTDTTAGAVVIIL